MTLDELIDEAKRTGQNTGGTVTIYGLRYLCRVKYIGNDLQVNCLPIYSPEPSNKGGSNAGR